MRRTDHRPCYWCPSPEATATAGWPAPCCTRSVGSLAGRPSSESIRLTATGFRCRFMLAASRMRTPANCTVARPPLCRRAVRHGQRTQHRAVIDGHLLDAVIRGRAREPGSLTICVGSQSCGVKRLNGLARGRWQLIAHAASFRSRANTLSPSQRCIARLRPLLPFRCRRPARSSSSTVANPIQIAVIVLKSVST